MKGRFTIIFFMTGYYNKFDFERFIGSRAEGEEAISRGVQNTRTAIQSAQKRNVGQGTTRKTRRNYTEM